MKPHLLLLALLPALPALAQVTPATAPDAPTRVGRREIGSDTPPEPQAEEATQRLVGQLSLTPEQPGRCTPPS